MGSNASYAYGRSGSSTGERAFADLRKLRLLEEAAAAAAAEEENARLDASANLPPVDLNMLAIIFVVYARTSSTVGGRARSSIPRRLRSYIILYPSLD